MPRKKVHGTVATTRRSGPRQLGTSLWRSSARKSSARRSNARRFNARRSNARRSNAQNASARRGSGSGGSSKNLPNSVTNGVTKGVAKRVAKGVAERVTRGKPAAGGKGVARSARDSRRRSADGDGAGADFPRTDPATLQGGGLLKYIKALAVAAGLAGSGALAASAYSSASDVLPPAFSNFDMNLSVVNTDRAIEAAFGNSDIVACIADTDNCSDENLDLWENVAPDEVPRFRASVMQAVKSFGSGGYFAKIKALGRTTAKLLPEGALKMLVHKRMFWSTDYSEKAQRAVALMHQTNPDGLLPSAQAFNAVFDKLLKFPPSAQHAVEAAKKGFVDNMLMTRLLYEPSVTFGVIALKMPDLMTDMLKPVLKAHVDAADVLSTLLIKMRMSPRELRSADVDYDHEYENMYELVNAVRRMPTNEVSLLSDDGDELDLEALVNRKVAEISQKYDMTVQTPTIEQLEAQFRATSRSWTWRN